jgi:hypothetical protein
MYYANSAAGMADASITGNRIFGGGHMLTGIAVMVDAEGFNVSGNFIHMQSTTPLRESPGDSYGALSRVSGLRTWGADLCSLNGQSTPCPRFPDDFDFHDNVVAMHARDGGDGRGLWLYSDTNVGSNQVRNNTVTFTVEDTILTPDMDSGAVVLTGEVEREGQLTDPPIILSNNSIESNFINVMIGHDYGASSDIVFRDNTIEKTGNRADYNTIRIGFYTNNHTGHQFHDTIFAGGASFDQVEWLNAVPPSADNNFAVGKRRNVLLTNNGTPLASQMVMVENLQTNEVFAAVTDASGNLTIDLDPEISLLHFLSEESGNTGFGYEFTVMGIGTGLLSLDETAYDSDDTLEVQL